MLIKTAQNLKLDYVEKSPWNRIQTHNWLTVIGMDPDVLD